MTPRAWTVPAPSPRTGSGHTAPAPGPEAGVKHRDDGPGIKPQEQASTSTVTRGHSGRKAAAQPPAQIKAGTPTKPNRTDQTSLSARPACFRTRPALHPRHHAPRQATRFSIPGTTPRGRRTPDACGSQAVDPGIKPQGQASAPGGSGTRPRSGRDNEPPSVP